ncbi:MAG: DUF4300 family protein [Aminipila sp.]
MKKKLIIISMLVLSAVLSTGCKGQDTTQNKLLEGSNLSNVDTYLKYMTDYQNGKVLEQDYNCRTAAFTLLEDSITATPQKNYNNYLMFDIYAIENDDNFKQIQDHKGEFIALFDGASVDGVANDQFEQVYPNALKERNVQFNNDKASLISVIMHDPYEKWLFVGHSGVLIPQDDKFVFFEKLAPDQDYQAKTFSSKEELKKELLSRPAYRGDGSEHEPMIYENGVLMK